MSASCADASSQAAPRPSALLLSDRLISLAELADIAGHRIAAGHLLTLAHRVLDGPELRPAPLRPWRDRPAPRPRRAR